MKILKTFLVLAVLAALCTGAVFAGGGKEAEPMGGSKALADNKITIAWIPKALNNPVFEIGRQGALPGGGALRGYRGLGCR
jgi:ABC-type sugar transport system substrate-binding protein